MPRNRRGGFEKQAAPSDWQLDDLKQSEQLERARRNDATERVPRELHAVDVEADWARAQLDRALRLQMDRIDRLRTELIDLFAQTQVKPTSEVVVWFEPRSVAGEPANEGASDDEKANGTESGTAPTARFRSGGVVPRRSPTLA